ncbi:hypothetical protein ABT408_35955, partial [Streptomyces halstedii]|uniref:hypothetical protein n=1 Tax=Streptomyces halstedii TaxID=1944 RepID=UPI00335DFDD1
MNSLARFSVNQMTVKQLSLPDLVKSCLTLGVGYGEDELVFAVMDPRRSLRGAIPEEYNGGYAY